MNKTCKTCGAGYPETLEFWIKRRTNKDGSIGFHTDCKECLRKQRREHYTKNKGMYALKTKKCRQRIKDWFVNYKKKLKCCKCGENKYWRLDFHHHDQSTKEHTISSMINNCSRKRVLDEITKCQVLCANCHRDEHFKP